MSDKKIRTMVMAAVLAALACVATMVVQIPSPMNGFVNLGDCFVLLSGWLLGPWWGAAAGGIGSMLADLLLGYGHYAPGTLVIKGLMALVGALVFKAFGKSTVGTLVSGVVSEVVMVAGYFGYAALLLVGFGTVGDVQGGDGQKADGVGGLPDPARQLQCRAVDVPHQVGRPGQAHLAADRAELGVPDAHGYAAAVQSLLPQAGGHAVTEHLQAAAHLLPAGQILRKRGAVAHGLHRLLLMLGADGGIVQPIGVAV